MMMLNLNEEYMKKRIRSPRPILRPEPLEGRTPPGGLGARAADALEARPRPTPARRAA
jgi:hypothetical protein